MSPKSKRARRGLALPLVLITIGLVFLLNNLSVLQGDLKTVIFRLWPILLIIGGIDYLFRSRGVLGSVVMIGGGFVFLLGGFDLLGDRSSWYVALRLWPVLMVAFGLEMLTGKRSLWATFICVLISLLVMGGALWLVGARVSNSPVDATHQLGPLPQLLETPGTWPGDEAHFSRPPLLTGVPS